MAILQNNNVPVQANQQNQSGFVEVITTDVQTAIQEAPNTQTATAIQECVEKKS